MAVQAREWNPETGFWTHAEWDAFERQLNECLDAMTDDELLAALSAAGVEFEDCAPQRESAADGPDAGG